jgi:hypothetical protein
MLYYTKTGPDAGLGCENAVSSIFCSQAKNGTGRAGTALAIFALLLQAMVFAWHHHPPAFAARQALDLAGQAVTASADVPLLADRDCQICFALGHHGAVPVDLFAAVLPEAHPPERLGTTPVFVSLPPYLLFRSRAPPLA